MPQENIENEGLLVSRDPWFNWGLRNGVQAAIETEETVDRIVETVIETATSLPDMSNMLSIRMGLDEGLGYRGGQRLCHERPYLTALEIDRFSNASWQAMSRSRFDRNGYRSGFHAGFFDEYAGLAQPLPA